MFKNDNYTKTLGFRLSVLVVHFALILLRTQLKEAERMTHACRYAPSIVAAEVESASFTAAFFAGRSEAAEHGQPKAQGDASYISSKRPCFS